MKRQLAKITALLLILSVNFISFADTFQYQYDSGGLLKEVNGQNGNLKYTYDTSGNLLTEEGTMQFTAPQNVAGVSGNGKVTVSFLPPACNGGSFITSYTVTASPGGKTVSGANSPLTVSGLTNGTPYTFTVTATNGLGGSPISAVSAPVTPMPTVPDVPTGITATTDAVQTKVFFTAPDNGGSPITSYTVTSNPGGITANGLTSPVMINGLTRGTAYTFFVKANNAVGSSSSSTASSSILANVTAPAAPTGVSATTENAKAIISFVAGDDGGSPITSYTVTANPGGKTATGTSSPITMTGLTNGVTYTFTVKSTNVVGTGTTSSPSASVTLPTLLPAAPTGVTAVAGVRKATVSFTAPDNGGSPITSYTVTSTPGGINTTGKTSPISVTGLTNGTAYTFAVRATNASGIGPASESSPSVTPSESVPGIPRYIGTIAGNSQVKVSFYAPVEDGGRPITSYTVTASPGGATATGTSSPIVVTGLTNGTAYTFTVKAVNAVGVSPASNPTSSVTPFLSVPGVPQYVSASPGSTKASVSFYAPSSDGNSPITAYTVTASPGGATVTGLSSPLVVTGLTNGTAYTFTVKATNAVGVGPASNPTSSVTPFLSVPGVPQYVSASPGSTKASVSFYAPSSDGNSPITSYTVTASPGGATVTGTSSPIVVTGLTNGTAYTFTVKATNAVGVGPASTPSSSVIPFLSVPGVPQYVSAKPGSTKASVSFYAPSSDGNSPITSYTVTASPGGATVTGTSSPIVVTGLTNGTAYTFTVKAANAVGAGPASNPTSSVTPFLSVPGAPQYVSATPGSTKAFVSFYPPSSDGNSPITSYTVTASPGGAIATGTSSPIVVTGLTNGTVYTFTVKATNAVGTGSFSTESASIIPAVGVPWAPAIMNGTCDNGQATITFIEPIYDGGSPITSYTVTANPGGISSTGSGSPLTVNGLAAGTDYTFTVTAKNAIGTSPASTSITPAPLKTTYNSKQYALIRSEINTLNETKTIDMNMNSAGVATDWLIVGYTPNGKGPRLACSIDGSKIFDSRDYYYTMSLDPCPVSRSHEFNKSNPAISATIGYGAYIRVYKKQ